MLWCLPGVFITDNLLCIEKRKRIYLDLGSRGIISRDRVWLVFKVLNCGSGHGCWMWFVGIFDTTGNCRQLWSMQPHLWLCCGCRHPKSYDPKRQRCGPQKPLHCSRNHAQTVFNHAQTVFQNLGCIYLYNMIYKPGCSSTLNNRVMPELYTHSRLWFLSLFLSCGLIAVTMGFELLFCS